MRMNQLAAFAALAMVAAPAAAQVTTYDANPTRAPFVYGTGNDYTPANAVVLSSTSDDLKYEIAGRAHVSSPGTPAASTGGTGIYTFALNTANVGFDFSFFRNALPGALVTITNVGTGADATFAAALLGTIQSGAGNGALQGSQQFGFGFLNGSIDPNQDIDFNNAIDSTYRVDLTGGNGTLTDTFFAQFGAGATAAVPEPATWAMMLLGFGAMGVSLRRRRKLTNIAQVA